MKDINTEQAGLEDVREEEKRRHKLAIAEWIKGVMASTGLKPTAWSIKAGMSRSTVGRALNPKYTYITSTMTLIKLAQAAGVAPPLDLGVGAAGIPTSTVFTRIVLVAMKRIAPGQTWTEAQLDPVGRALRMTLLELAENPEGSNDVAMAERAARMAIRQQLDQ